MMGEWDAAREGGRKEGSREGHETSSNTGQFILAKKAASNRPCHFMRDRLLCFERHSPLHSFRY